MESVDSAEAVEGRGGIERTQRGSLAANWPKFRLIGDGMSAYGPPTRAIVQRAEMRGTLCVVASLSFLSL